MTMGIYANQGISRRRGSVAFFDSMFHKLAEIQNVMKKRIGGFLRERKGSIKDLNIAAAIIEQNRTSIACVISRRFD